MNFGVRSKNVLTSEGMRDATLIIDDGIIKDIINYDHSLGNEVYDFGSLIVMPGLVDTHVHINEPGRSDWEGFETATKAAAAGGITMLVDMPLNSSPVTVNLPALEKKLQAAENKLYVDCGFYGGLIPGNVNELESLIDAGVLGLKAFMIDSGIDEFPNVTYPDLRRALILLSGRSELKYSYKIPLLVHAEIDQGEPDSENSDAHSFNSFLQSRPRDWENRAIEILINLCKEFNYPVHIVHLSSSDSIEIIQQAKNDGLPITVETCPHYLFFSSEDVPYGDTRYKCTPPIRENENKEKLWEAVRNGTIDCLVSDHSPCNPELKSLKDGNFENAWGGISSLQLSLSVIWTAAKERSLTIDNVSKLMCENPAELVGIGETKGKIKKGYDADLVIFNPEKKFIVREQNLFHRHKITPYSNKELCGVVLTTFVRGKKVFDNGQIVSSPTGRAVLNQNFQPATN